MFTTVCLNPCFDRSVFVEHLSLGEHNEAQRTRCDISGKGVNVNTVLRQLGADSCCVGFEYTDSGRQLEAYLAGLGVPLYGVDVCGAMRTNLKITDTATGHMTEINERGCPVSPQNSQEVLARLEAVLPQTDCLIVDGSAPPGVPSTMYAQMIRLARSHGVRTLLDASGPLLAEGLQAKPWMIKPNLFELERLFGTKIDKPPMALALCRELVRAGVEAVCLSLGAMGAYLITENEALYSEGLPIAVKGRQGAGDSMVAGLCLAASKGLAPREQLRWAVAAAHGSLLREGTLLCTREDFEALLPRIPVSPVSIG